MPASTHAGHISKEGTNRLAALLRGNPKSTNWNAIETILLTYHPNLTDPAAPNLDGLLRQALHRACFDRSGRSSLQSILEKLILSLPERVQYASTAVRCKNMAALQAIIYGDPSVLSYCSNGAGDATKTMGSSRGITLLHLVCERHGWNEEIRFILQECLKHNRDSGDGSSHNSDHKGLFHATEDAEMPLTLSLQAGSDLGDILDHVQEAHPDHLKENLDRVSQIIAEYGFDGELLRELIRSHAELLLEGAHPRDGSTPLHFACYYQNEDMLRFLLLAYFDHSQSCGEESTDTYNRLLRVQQRLLSLNNDGLSSLGHLLLSVGDPDAETSWSCVEVCVEFFSERYHESRYVEEERRGARPPRRFRLAILQLFLSHAWDQLLASKNCTKILDHIVHRLEIDACGVDDDTGSTVLSIAIKKMAASLAANATTNSRVISMQILNVLMELTAVTSNPGGGCPAATRDKSGRLPLHLACAHSLTWYSGLERIVTAHMPAVASVDPISGLPPFAHCAVGANSDLESIYGLLRLHPGSIDSLLSCALPNHYRCKGA